MDVESRIIVKTFSELETRNIVKKWMEAFGKNKQGLNTKSYKWHLFSGGGYPSQEGDIAMREYEAHVAAKYVVMDNGPERALLVDAKPTGLNDQDVYVFPENIAWTMAFTHEEGWLGPYFAKHSSYRQLEAENEKQLQKLKEIAIAKSKGWY